jgi:hypothetical protein
MVARHGCGGAFRALVFSHEALLRSFFDWFQNNGTADEPWLMLGKGPSFSLRTQLDLSGYRRLSLNHAVREQPVHVAHVIDIDVIEACGETLERNAGVVVLPWYPHVGNRVGGRTLADHAREIPQLLRLDAEGRLLWYDLSTSPIRHGPGPVIQATYFSAEAALNLLATAGVRCVRSLGVDGGSAYSRSFEDLQESTLLANGRTTFDLQFEGFARTILDTGVDFAPLNRRTPATVYVAHTPDEALQVQVLEHSIRRRASLTVEVVLLPARSRGSIRKGDGVVLTSRAQVLADLRPLWKVEPGDLDVVVPRESELAPGLVLVGPGLSDRIPAVASQVLKRATATRLAGAVPAALQATLAPKWNPGWSRSPDVDAPILCYPADGSEPWLSRSHPLGHLWTRDLLDAISRGFIRTDAVAEQVALGHVRPSLLYQIEQGLEEPLLLRGRARRMDRDFRPAQQTEVATSRQPQWSSILQAVARQLGRRTRALRQRAGHRQPPSNSGLVIRQ